MNAQELFEKLGYKRKDVLSIISYESDLTDTLITFITNKKKGNRVHIYPIENKFQDSGMISYAEIKAILKQIEELGWKDDTDEQIEWVKNETTEGELS